MTKRIIHIGIAVRNLEQARSLYAELFETQPSPPMEGDGMRVSMLQLGEIKIELMASASEESVLTKFLEQRGEGVQHICIEVDNIDAELKALKERGIQLVSETPGDGLEGKIAFLHPKSTHGVLIELCELASY
jgi:methylmalonyl-CoA/ethylmalonyl-CoA epimerase